MHVCQLKNCSLISFPATCNTALLKSATRHLPTLTVHPQQQTYGSQQHLADHHYQQQRPMQQSFGSSPHLPQAYNAPVSAYSSRPPSRDPYQQQLHHQQQQPMPMPQPMQYVNEHGQYMSPPQPAHYMPQQAQQPQSIYSDNGAAYNHSNHSPYGGAPQYRSSVVYDDYGQPTNHFYLHESSPQPQAHQHPQRRTWAHSAAAAAYEQQQQIQPSLVDVNAWQTQQHQKQKQTWMNRPPSSAGAPSPGSFMLHQNGGGGGGGGGGGELQHLFQVQASPQHGQRQVSGSNGVQRQQSLTNLRDNRSPKAPQNMGMPMGMPMQQEDMMAPQSICFIGDEEDVDELERNIIESMQSTHISDFVHQQQQQHQHQQQLQQQQRLQGHSGRGSSSEDYDSGEMISNKLNITSGNLTYRIPSPSRPSIQANSFQDPRAMAAASGGEDQPPEKGFYISFDDEQPKRPKPPLRAKRSPKKESPPGSRDSVDNQATLKRESLSHLHNNNNIGFGNDDVNSKPVTRHSIHGLNNSNSVKSPGNATYNKYTDEPPIQLRQLAVSGAMSPTSNERHHLDDVSNQSPQQTQQPMSPTRLQQSSNNAEAAKNKALVIGADSTNLDPVRALNGSCGFQVFFAIKQMRGSDNAISSSHIKSIHLYNYRNLLMRWSGARRKSCCCLCNVASNRRRRRRAKRLRLPRSEKRSVKRRRNERGKRRSKWHGERPFWSSTDSRKPLKRPSERYKRVALLNTAKHELKL